MDCAGVSAQIPSPHALIAVANISACRGCGKRDGAKMVENSERRYPVGKSMHSVSNSADLLLGAEISFLLP